MDFVTVSVDPKPFNLIKENLGGTFVPKEIWNCGFISERFFTVMWRVYGDKRIEYLKLGLCW